MNERGGEKWSWYLGSLGSSCWILVGAGMMVVQGELAKGKLQGDTTKDTKSTKKRRAAWPSKSLELL